MNNPAEFLEGWFAAFYKFDGAILVLQAFFDETGGHETHAITAVAGFVYDKAGLTEFTEGWKPHVADLSKPYRTSSCNAAREPFQPPDWPEWRRQNLINDLAALSTKHSLAGFVVATRKCDFENALENGPGIENMIDSPYTLCVWGVLVKVSEWVSEHYPDMKVHHWLESGGYHENETRELIGRLRNMPATQTGLLNIERVTWLPKADAPAFCSADLLAWEWRQNVLKSPDQWTPRMNSMITRMNGQSKQLIADHITGQEATVRALSILLPGIHLD